MFYVSVRLCLSPGERRRRGKKNKRFGLEEMDVITKLYSSVSQSVTSTVSQLSGVLPGNPVTREYEVSHQVASAGIGLLWKVYNGYKKTTRQEVSVFVFEKKQLERWPKDDREMMFDILKRGVQQLTKIRHPHVLTVQHPLEESRESLAFATEPVISSLANLLGSNNNNDLPPTEKLYDVEIKHGILQLSEGLIFLHSDMKIIHKNLCPESIIVNKQGNWKIFGFDFCIANQQTPDGKLFWPHQEYNSTWHALTQPYLEYTAPEVALNSINTTESDLFSLGVLIFAIYSNGKPIKLFGKDYGAFRRFANELNSGKYPNLSNVPSGLSDFLKCLLHPSPEHRPKLQELSKIAFFEDVGVKTLTYLDSLYQWDNLQKSKFYKGLPQIIPTLPHRVNMQSILPCLIKEFVNSPMIPFVLPNVLLISENCTKKDFTEQILPELKPIMKLQEPIQILLIFMKKMDLMLKLTPAEEVKLNVLPMLYRALECDMPQMQELCLGILPTFSSLIDYNATKNALLPRIKKLCLNSPNVSVKVNCLICIGKLLENLDKWLVLDEILPFLIQIQSREPAVLMAIVGIYKIAMTNAKLGISKEVMANKIIPFLMPLCIENGLTISQFNTIINLLKTMVNRVETEHRVKLEQLSTIQKEAETLDPADAVTKELSFDSKSAPIEDIFANVKISPPPSYTVPGSEIKTPSEQILSSTIAAKSSSDNNSNKASDTSLKPLKQIQVLQSQQTTTTSTTNISAQNLNKSNNNFMDIQPISNNFKILQQQQQIQNQFNFMGSTTTTAITAPANNWIQPNRPPQMFNNLQIKLPLNTNINNNNMSSLASLDPLAGIRNSNKMTMNQMSTNVVATTGIAPNNFEFGSMAASSTPFMNNNQLNQQNNNINALSQQDILDFLK